MEKNPRKALFVLTMFIFWYANYAFVPIFSTYCKASGASVAMIGVIASAYGLSQLISRVPFGILSDSLGKRKIFILTFGFGSILIASSVMALFPYPMVLFFMRLLTGVSASSWVCATVMYSSYFDGKDSAKAISVMNMTSTSGQVAANLSGGLAADHISQAAPFCMSAVAAAAGLILCIFTVEKKQATRENRKKPDIKGLLSVGKNRLLVIISLLAALSQYIAFGLAITYVPLVARGMGASDTELGVLSMCLPLAGLPANFIAGTRLLPYHRRKHVIVGCIFAMSALSVIYMMVNSVGALIVVQSGLGFFRSLMFTVCMSMAIGGVAAEKRGSAMGFFQAVYSLGIFFGPLITGWVCEGMSMAAGFYLTAGLAAGCGVAAVFCPAQEYQ